MSVTASCGHLLRDDDGPDGMGWSLAVKSYSRENTPAVSYCSYCTACRDKALAMPGHVLADACAELEWLNSEDGTSSEVSTGLAVAPPSYGVWTVWESDPREPDDREPVLMGTYRGFVDDIALTLNWSEDTVGYFRRETDNIEAVDVGPPASSVKLPEALALNVLQDSGLLADQVSNIEPFFEGRPVFVRYSEWGGCVSLFPLSGPLGALYQRKRERLLAVLSKLTAEDIAVLKGHGLKT